MKKLSVLISLTNGGFISFTVITVDRSKSANNISEFHRSDAMLHTSKCLDDKVVEYAECVDMSKSFNSFSVSHKPL